MVSQGVATTQVDVVTTIPEAAMAWYDAGMCVIPPREDGTKGPAWSWKKYQTQRASREETQAWFTAFPRQGLGLLCGQVSGNLEMMELEGCATSSTDIDAIIWECQARGVDWLWDLLTQDGYAEWTPSGGLHFLYQVDGSPVPGNHKIAQRPGPDGKGSVTLAETRGEGGYVIVAPSAGNVHPTGQSWDLAAGSWGKVPTITTADRDLLQEAIHAALDQMPEVPKYQPPVRPVLQGSGTRPGDDFMARTDWADILEPEGFQVTKQHGLYREWERPGKNQGTCSVTTGKTPEDRLYCFSSNTPFFEPGQVYNKFAAYVLINHGYLSKDTISQATKDLSAKGFGTPLERTAPSAAHLLLDSAQTMGNQAPNLVPQNPALPNTEDVQPSTPVGWLEDFRYPSLDPGSFLDEDFTLQGAGNLFAKGYENAFKYCEDTKKWWFWTGRVWRLDGRARHEQATKELINIGRKAARQASIEEQDYAKALNAHINKMANAQAPNVHRWARSDRRIGIDCSQLDAISHMVTVENGILDLDSGTLMPHDPQMLLTKQLPVTFDKDAQCPQWESFMEQALPDPEIRTYLQRAIGHTLLGNAEQRALFLLYGPSGTGKSVFIRTMEQLFGDFAETATPATFNGSSKSATLTNDLNDLKGSRFVSVSELDEGEVLNESLVKRLTGGDTAKSRGLWQENSTWRVQFTMWLATNNLPRLNSDDNAIWRRVKPVHFAHVAKDNGGEVLRLAEKIFAEEASGILNWALEGIRLYQEQGLEDLDQITAAVDAYRREVDVVEQFISSSLEEGVLVASEGVEIQSSRLYHIFTDWCRTNGMRGLFSNRRFSQRLERMGFQKKIKSTANFWQGIGTGGQGLLGTMT